MSTRDFIKPVSLKNDWPLFGAIILVVAAFLFTPRYSLVRGATLSSFGQSMFVAGAIACPLGLIALKRRKDAWGLLAAIVGVAALVPACQELLRPYDDFEERAQPDASANVGAAPRYGTSLTIGEMETEEDAYYALGDFVLFDARKILPRLEEEKIRFQISSDHSGLASLPAATAGYGMHGNGSKITIYLHREDE